MTNKVPAPAGFADNAHLTVSELSEMYGACRMSIVRWRKETGTARSAGWNKRPMPDDFAESAKTLGLIELSKKYSASKETARRWLIECGVTHQLRDRTAAPENFAAVAHLPSRHLQAMFKAARMTIAKWREELGIKAQHGLSKPVPDDFEELCGKYTSAAIARHYGVSASLVRWWRSRAGITVKYRDRIEDHIPPDFAEMAATMSITALSFHYGCNFKTAKKWVEVSGVTPKRVTTPIKYPVPDDWQYNADRMSFTALMARYGVSKHVIDRWIRETGIKPVTQREGNTVPVKGFVRVQQSFRAPEIGLGLAERAAHHLRRFYGNVHRCDLKLYDGNSATWGDRHNLPNHGKGRYYVHGRGILTNDQVIELGRKHGFDPDGWKAMAA